MERLTSAIPALTHDLIRLHEGIALIADSPVPEWVGPVLKQIPWVVVRRGHIRDGIIPIGVRGRTRSQRFGGFITAPGVANRLSPEDLTQAEVGIDPKRKQSIPALAALDRIAPILACRDCRWGPGGSVGFEIATRVHTTTTSSDLDLVLRQDDRLEPDKAAELLLALAKASTPARVDVVLETPNGGVSLAELATMRAQVLVRTPHGPRLFVDPWVVDSTTLAQVVS